MRKILIVEDDTLLNRTLGYNLASDGYEITAAYNHKDAVSHLKETEFDVALLDINLPDGSGLDLCEEIRGRGQHTYIIFITANDKESDMLKGYEAGGADYVTKPFNILELKARIRALLKRSAGRSDAVRTLLTVGDLSLDTQQRVAIRDGKTIDLTAKEYDLLELLMKNPRRVYSRESLMDLVWGYSYAGDYRTVDVHVRRLREKLERVPAEPAYIMTKWGVGYYFQGENQPTV